MDRLVAGYKLVEAPVWHDGALHFSDVVGGGFHRLNDDGSVETVIPHRRGMGGVVPHADGGFVVSGRNISWKRGDETTVLFDDETSTGFNDLTTDADGRVYVGSLRIDPLASGAGSNSGEPGDLYCIDVDGTVRKVGTDVKLTNGLGVSPDGTKLYHSDSNACVVWVYDREPDGSLHDRRPHHQWESDHPDGLAVASDGTVWVALATGGNVSVLDPDGSVADKLEVEVPMVTSVCFGGDDLRDLYVVTGANGAPEPVGGGVYRRRVDVAGLPIAPAGMRA